MELNTFNRKWNGSDQTGQLEILEKSLKMPLRDAIVPVVTGLVSFHFLVRNRSREILDILQNRMTQALEADEKTDAIVDSALISVHLSNQIHGNLTPQEMKLYLETLLEFGGRSPFYAWKICRKKMTDGRQLGLQAISLVASTVSEQGRLALVVQYLSAAPSLRRAYADPFLKMLRGISDAKAVMTFCAHLFDHEIPYDLFVENIKPTLRNSADLLSMALSRKAYGVEERNQALKAAAVLSEGINPTLILKLMTTETSPEIRKTTFKIVEQSSVGSYYQLTDTILDTLIALNPDNEKNALSDTERSDRLKEAMTLFKAAVISRGRAFSLRVLLHKTVKDFPELMPLIQQELSSFSRVAICFIQEMAEDPSGTLFHNSPVQHALICGMIRKRPERILSQLQIYRDHPNARIGQALSRLKETISPLLDHEKKRIRVSFDAMLQHARNFQPKKEKSGFFKSMFRTTLDQKIEALKTSDTFNEMRFEEELFEGIDLSFNTIPTSIVFYRCVIRDVDFSFSTFEDVHFYHTTFYCTKMIGSAFQYAHFEKCVFIDASAVGATFYRCSFTGSSIFKSNFDSAVMEDAVFADCHLALTRFSRYDIENTQGGQGDGNNKNGASQKRGNSLGGDKNTRNPAVNGMGIESIDGSSGTDLSGATFVGSRISYVSFEKAKLDNTDFSGVVGKFCRFTPHSLSKAETEYASLAEKIFDLPTQSVSPLLKIILQDTTIANEWNLLLFTELIQQGKRTFFQKNRYALTVAFDLFQPEQADLFELVPLLLHENIDLYKSSSRSRQLAQMVFDATWKDRKRNKLKKIPKGIAGYLPGAETEKLYRKYAAAKYLDNDYGIAFRENRDSAIEGVFTIGSIGSIAHTQGSDIDYWVCIQSVMFDNEMITLLNEKLRAIESWAELQFKTEIHFFIVDIEDAKRSIFGESDSESSGSAQGRLLKEEFYRSMIHVAGKIPFWATLSTKVSKNYYHDLYVRACPTPKSGMYIDFGDIHDIPVGEYFGASVWQMFKYLKSPFKSVLKMGLLERYIHEKKDSRMLLCNQFKDHWMNPGLQFSLTKSDPYYILLKSLVAFYGKNINKKQFCSLVQSCFFSKIHITDDKSLRKSAFGLKWILVEKCMEEWGWEKGDVFRAGDINNWSFRAMSKESLRIERFMVRTYNSVRDALGVSTEEESLLTPRDRTVLGRKMFVQFNKEASKVQTVLLVASDGLLNGLSLLHSYDRRKQSVWTLIHKWGDRKKGIEEVEQLKSASTVEDIAAWLIHNRLYSPDAYIKLDPNPTHVRANDIRLLLKNMYDFFLPDMERGTASKDLFNKSRIDSLFVSVNFTSPRNAKVITECSAVYRNSWGEMFCQTFDLPPGIRNSADVIYQIKRDLDWKVVPERYKLFRIQN